MSIPLASILPPDLNMMSAGKDKQRGNCPITDHRSSRTFSTARHPDGHFVWQCFACGMRGSVIDLFAAMNQITVAAAIAKLSEKNLEPVSKAAILQRAYDQIERARPEFGYLACNKQGCPTVRGIANELDFAILRAGGSWQWKVSPNGNKAICYKH